MYLSQRSKRKTEKCGQYKASLKVLDKKPEFYVLAPPKNTVWEGCDEMVKKCSSSLETFLD